MHYLILSIVALLVIVLAATVITRDEVKNLLYVDSNPRKFEKTAKGESLRTVQMHLRATW